MGIPGSIANLMRIVNYYHEFSLTDTPSWGNLFGRHNRTRSFCWNARNSSRVPQHQHQRLPRIMALRSPRTRQARYSPLPSVSCYAGTESEGSRKPAPNTKIAHLTSHADLNTSDSSSSSSTNSFTSQLSGTFFIQQLNDDECFGSRDSHVKWCR
ncbi:unnamed protein product, partial [Nesidiocoris tenuis]